MAKVKLEYIELGGENRPVLFSNYSLYLWSKWTGKTITDLGRIESMSFSDLMDLFRAGLHDGALQAGQNPRFTERDVCLWLTESPEAKNVLLTMMIAQVMASVGEVEEPGKTEPEPTT
jgi:hypothetical protein